MNLIQLYIQHGDVGNTYTCNQGATYIDNFNEELDSASVILTHITEDIPIEPYDDVFLIITSDSGTVRYPLIVDSFAKTQVSFSAPIYYQYDISLVSKTKLLEKIILPNLKITKLWENPRNIYGGDVYPYTPPYNNKQWGYLDTYLETFTRYNEYGTKWSYSDEVKERFANIECPEFQWNTPTFREVLTDLMMVDDCIPILNQNTIGLLDLSQEGSEADTSGFVKIIERYEGTDYVSQLDVSMQNSLQVKRTSEVENTVQICEHIQWQPESGSILTSENMCLKTMFPIYNLIKLDMGSFYTLTGYAKFYMHADLVEKGVAVEYNEYITKDVYYWTLFGETREALRYDFDNISQYQSFCVYYTRGDNVITGFSNTTYTLTMGSNTDDDSSRVNVYTYAVLWRAISRLFAETAEELYENGYLASGAVPEEGQWFDLWGDSLADDNHLAFFTVVYETQSDCIFKANKPITTSLHHVESVDNQTSSYVDATNYGIMEYLKLNRLGNKVKIIQARYSDISQVPELTQTYENYIIYKRDIRIFNDYIEVFMYATPNYILKDYFTSIQAKRRSWRVDSSENALERHEIIKYYLEFNYEAEQGAYDNLTNICKNCLEVFTFNRNLQKWQDYGTAKVLCRFHYYGNEQSETEYFYADSVKRFVGNSIIISWGTNDNYYWSWHNVGDTEGGIGYQPYIYGDEDGENFGVEFVLVYRINAFNIESEDYYTYEDDIVGMIATNSDTYLEESGIYNVSYTEATAKAEAFLEKVRELPLVDRDQFDPDYDSTHWEENVIMEGSYNYCKDSLETMKFHLQFEFCSASEDLVFGHAFIENIPFINGNDLTKTFYAYFVNDRKPTFRNQNYVPNVSNIEYTINFTATSTATISVESETDSLGNEHYYLYIYFGIFGLARYNYCYLCNANNELMLAFDASKITSREIKLYLNLKKIR